jgi:hypothetical protein
MRPLVSVNSRILGSLVLLALGISMTITKNVANGLANMLIPWLGTGFIILAVLMLFQSKNRVIMTKPNVDEPYKISALSLIALGLAAGPLFIIYSCIKGLASGLVIVSIMAGSFFLFIPLAIFLVLSVWSFLLALFTVKYQLSIFLSVALTFVFCVIRNNLFGL